MPTRKMFRPAKYLREKNMDPRNTLEKKSWAKKRQWHDGTKPTRPMMV